MGGGGGWKERRLFSFYQYHAVEEGNPVQQFFQTSKWLNIWQQLKQGAAVSLAFPMPVLYAVSANVSLAFSMPVPCVISADVSLAFPMPVVHIVSVADVSLAFPMPVPYVGSADVSLAFPMPVVMILFATLNHLKTTNKWASNGIVHYSEHFWPPAFFASETERNTDLS